LERLTRPSAGGLWEATMWSLLLPLLVLGAASGLHPNAYRSHVPGLSSGWTPSAVARRSARQWAARRTRDASILTKPDENLSPACAPPLGGSPVATTLSLEAAFGRARSGLHGIPEYETGIARPPLHGAACPRAPPALALRAA
jgi:hypothetical protein